MEYAYEVPYLNAAIVKFPVVWEYDGLDNYIVMPISSPAETKVLNPVTLIYVLLIRVQTNVASTKNVFT